MKHPYCLLATVCCLILVATSALAQDSSFSGPQICKATIAMIMGRDPSIIRTDRVENGVVYLSYVRPDDGTRWTYRCRIDGKRVLWGSVDGRWRDHPDDEVVTYAVRGGQLHIEERYSDGSANQESFSLEQLGD